ncbi:uncharacterized protein LOC110861736 isoform X2 [Folsomia candida]|nr:uncharacterized protein LOC110861736 isoform X2 [Folsomia candida]
MIATYLAYAASGYFMDKRFVVAHFNYFCPDGFTTTSNYIPCECALQVFSLTEGLLPLEKVLNFDICGLIDPSPDAVPIGMRSEAIQAADGLKIPHIGQAVAERDASSELADCTIWTPSLAYQAIRIIIEKYAPRVTGEEKWVFVASDNVFYAERCLRYLQTKVSGDNNSATYTDDCPVRFAPLSLLALELKKLCLHVGGSKIPNFKNEENAAELLLHEQYAYNPKVACRWHSKADHMDVMHLCSNNIVKRMIYNLVGYIRITQGLPVFPPLFKPADSEVDVVDWETVVALERNIVKDQVKADKIQQSKYRYPQVLRSQINAPATEVFNEVNEVAEEDRDTSEEYVWNNDPSDEEC